ncbi:MAG: DegT/DnrJ/EryC1/StrS family aminotransferase [Candidatus Hinthialibacter sp.]
MEKSKIQRRRFMQSTTAAGLALAAPSVWAENAGENGTLALLGGKPVRTKPFLSWPIIDESYEKDWMDVLHKRGWCRLNGDYVSRFEKEYAEMLGVKDCIATCNGTNALIGSLNGLEIGPGDEVLVPPYTFVATINVVLMQHALPVFVDTDPKTFQMDADKIEERITDRTRAIIPVHLGGNVCDIDKIMAIAKKHNLAVIEDACQAHIAEWKGKKVGTFGNSGCFSFQVTKNLSSGEGGAIISDDIKLMDRIYSYHSNGRERTNTYGFRYINNGTNMRMTEFQGVLLLQQLGKLVERARTREENAAYLTNQLKEIPGIAPEEMYEGCTRNAYHLYMFRYDSSQFAGVSRGKFMQALRKEGIPCSSGYSPLNKEPFIESSLKSRAFQTVFSEEHLNRYRKENECPANDRLCNEEAVWFMHYMLLGDRRDMDEIAGAIRKIHHNAQKLAQA